MSKASLRREPFYWLFLADKNRGAGGKKAARKTTKAGGGGDDLLKIAQEQQVKLQKEREEIIAKVKEEAASKSAEEPESKDQTPKVEVKKEPKVELPAKGDDDVGEKPQEPAPTENKAEEEEPVQETKKRVRTGPLVPDTVTGELCQNWIF